jgi:hypothetical protein
MNAKSLDAMKTLTFLHDSKDALLGILQVHLRRLEKEWWKFQMG